MSRLCVKQTAQVNTMLYVFNCIAWREPCTNMLSRKRQREKFTAGGDLCQHLGYSFAHPGSAGHLFARFSGVPHDQGHIHDLAERLHGHSRAPVMVTQMLLPAPDTTLSSAYTGCNSHPAAYL